MAWPVTAAYRWRGQLQASYSGQLQSSSLEAGAAAVLEAAAAAAGRRPVGGGRGH